jgi:acetyltransferase-like isoleucine patch superfamily enzyme
MASHQATMSASALEAAIERAKRYPHKHFRKGELILSPEVFTTPGRETNVVISPYCLLDCTGSIRVGPWCNIGHRTRIYTHDTIHLGLEPLALQEEAFGVLWQDKLIGTDVWLHDGAIVLYQVTHIPDGFVLGAGSVLTKNPGAYEIWAGVPARKIAERRPMDPGEIEARVKKDRFLLKDALGEVDP